MSEFVSILERIRPGYKNGGKVIKPYGVSQAAVDKVDLDELKRLRSKGFSMERLAKRFKVSKTVLEKIIRANKLPAQVMGTKLSEKSLNLNENNFERIYSLIEKTGISTRLKKKISPKKLITLMQSDKKKKNSSLKFILLEEIGKARIKTISSDSHIENAIKNSLFY